MKGIKNGIKRNMGRYFKTNKEYFNFINKYKDKIQIDEVKILKSRIKVIYNIIN